MKPEEFKQIRTDLGLSQSQLADALGITSSRGVRYYEAGERPISGPVARHMEEFRDGKTI